MRRKDREVTERTEILKIMEHCDVCRLAFHAEEYPYILPLNFGMEIDGDEVTLYFHGAKEGTKYELMAQDNRVSFEMDCTHELVLDAEKGNCTMTFQSVIGCGRLELVPEEEKEKAILAIMRHYREEGFPYNRKILSMTTALKLKVENMTAKNRRMPTK